MIRSIRCKLHAWVLAGFLLVTSTPASAEEPDPAATALFRKGRELVAQGDWAAGCEKLAQSFDRQASASTLLNLARCDEHDGKLATAWARHVQALPLVERVADPLRRDELLRVAREGSARLEARLPRLEVVLTPPRPGVALTDETGRAVPVGEAVPLDPGTHVITARAPGLAEVRSTVVLVEGRTTSIALHLEASSSVTSSPSPSPPPVLPAAPPPPSVEPSRPVPWVGLGVGALGLSLGAIAVGFGVDAAGASRELRARCGSDLVCNENTSFDPDPLNERKNTGLGLAIGFGAASAVALGVATWLLLHPRAPSPAAGLGSPQRDALRFTF